MELGKFWGMGTMSIHSANRLAEYIRQLCQDAIPPDDATLWERFVQSNEKEAFEVLLHRHGSMVLACAHRILSDRSEAEDVFQATFLTLARSKNRIREPKALASWLYKTAYRFAIKSRARHRPLQMLPEEAISSAVVEEEVAWREVKLMLDEELQRLPERLRSPLILCYLCGLTRDEAARQLDCSFDILKRRLEEGRKILRLRLERRGITGAGLALAVLSPQALQAMVALPLVEACLVLIFTPEITIPATIASLTLTTTTVTKGLIMKSVLATLFCVSLGIWGYTEVGNSLEPQTKKNPPKEEAPIPKELTPAKEAPAVEVEFRRADWEQRRRSQENLKQIMLAIHHYSDTTKFLPSDLLDQADKPLLSWRVAILPYLGKEYEALYKQFKLDEPWDSEHNFKLLAKMPTVYRVGIEAKDSSHTYYQAFAGPDTPLHPQPTPAIMGGEGGPPMMGSAPSGLGNPGAAPPIGPGPPMGSGGSSAPARIKRIGLMNVTDGTSNTIGVVEAGPSVAWTKPADLPFDPSKPLTKLSGPFSNALHVAMLDGSTHALKRGIDEKVMRHLITMSDGHVTPPISNLHAALPPETADEKAQLKKKIDENRLGIDRFKTLQKENAALLDRLNRAPTDLDEAEELTDHLKNCIEALEDMNQALRAKVIAIESRATPKAPQKK